MRANIIIWCGVSEERRWRIGSGWIEEKGGTRRYYSECSIYGSDKSDGMWGKMAPVRHAVPNFLLIAVRNCLLI